VHQIIDKNTQPQKERDGEGKVTVRKGGAVPPFLAIFTIPNACSRETHSPSRASKTYGHNAFHIIHIPVHTTVINRGRAHTTQHRTHCGLWLRLQSWLMPHSLHRLRNDLKCAQWDVKPCSIQSNLIHNSRSFSNHWIYREQHGSSLPQRLKIYNLSLYSCTVASCTLYITGPLLRRVWQHPVRSPNDWLSDLDVPIRTDRYYQGCCWCCC